MLRQRLAAGTRVLTSEGHQGVVEAVEPGEGGQPEVGALPEYPQDVYYVRTAEGVTVCRDIDLEVS